MTAADALVLQNVTKRYGSHTAVNRLSLRAPAGEILGFLGPNGAGKTTTIRIIMSILYPDEGEVRILGQPRATDVKDRIGYLPEERGLYRKMTVDATLRYFGRLKGLTGKDLNARIGAALERVGLAEWRRKKVEALSKGMQQKLQFVGAVLHQPELVILDEPFTGLDPLNTETLLELMAEHRERGATVIFSTHQMETAQRLCDRLVLINRGRKLIEGSPSEIRSQFAMRMLTIEGEGDFRALAKAPGVVGAHVSAGQARLELSEGFDPNEILRRALESGRIARFEVHRPDLHEIFVKLVEADGAQPPSAPAPRAERPETAHA